MLVSLNISDDLMREVFETSARLSTHPEALMLQRLQASARLPAGNVRFVVLHGPPLQALEERLGGGQLADGEDLQRKVTRLANVQFGTYEITLTQAEREELKWRAAKANVSVVELLRRTAERLKQEFFPTATREAQRVIEERQKKGLAPQSQPQAPASTQAPVAATK